MKILHEESQPYVIRGHVTHEQRPSVRIPTEQIVGEAETTHFTRLAELKGVRRQIFRAHQASSLTQWHDVTARLARLLQDVDRSVARLQDPAQDQLAEHQRRAKTRV
jgi:hypothetical protein